MDTKSELPEHLETAIRGAIDRSQDDRTVLEIREAAIRVANAINDARSEVRLPRFLLGRPLHSWSQTAIATIAVGFLATLGLLFWRNAVAVDLSPIQAALERVERCTLRMTNREQPHLDFTSYIEKDGRIRIDYKLGLTQIYDPLSKLGVAFDSDSKTSWSWKPNATSSAWSIVERCLKASSDSAQSLGTQRHGNETLVGLLVKRPIRSRVWVEAESRLPRKIEQLDAYNRPEMVIDLEYPDVEGEHFRLDIPQGYAIVDKGMDFPEPKGVSHGAVLDWSISSSSGFGPIAFGDPLTKVEELLGKPTEKLFLSGTTASYRRSEYKAIDSAHAIYTSIGITLLFDSAERFVGTQLERKSPYSGFKPYTKPVDKGIKLGDAIERVKVLYGDPERTRGPANDPFAIVYSSQGVSFGIQNNHVQNMTISISDSK